MNGLLVYVPFDMYSTTQLTFIFSFFSVCACSKLVVASASFGNSVSASSVPNACRVCAVVFTIRANASIACREGSAALKC